MDISRFLKSLPIVAFMSVAALQGCGFQPLYGRGAGQSDTAKALGQVKIASIPDREGLALYNLLLDRINPGGRPTRPVYVLDSKLDVTYAGIGLNRDETTILRKADVTVDFAISKEGKPVRKFRSTCSSTFSDSSNDYATTVAERDALQRCLRQVADEARLQVATFLKQQNG